MDRKTDFLLDRTKSDPHESVYFSSSSKIGVFSTPERGPPKGKKILIDDSAMGDVAAQSPSLVL